jgi:hypothetical protein
MVEDIITALSRFKSLFVIARNSTFTYKGKAVDIKQVGRKLGVPYVLEGSVRQAAGIVRITGQLIGAATNNHLWADKFDGELEDVFELQDKVTASVVGSIAPKLEQAEINRAKRKSAEELGGADLRITNLSWFGPGGQGSRDADRSNGIHGRVLRADIRACPEWRKQPVASQRLSRPLNLSRRRLIAEFWA